MTSICSPIGPGQSRTPGRARFDCRGTVHPPVRACISTLANSGCSAARARNFMAGEKTKPGCGFAHLFRPYAHLISIAPVIRIASDRKVELVLSDSECEPLDATVLDGAGLGVALVDHPGMRDRRGKRSHRAAAHKSLKKRLAAWRSESRLRPSKYHQAGQGRQATDGSSDSSPESRR